jgi:hypothetical protein
LNHRRAIRCAAMFNSAHSGLEAARSRLKWASWFQRVVGQFEFMKACSLVDGVILSVAVLAAKRRISATMLCVTGDPSARW